jgi:hypothetical protein
MEVRGQNCDVTGDQLAFSGAVADGADNTNRDTQCAVPARTPDLADEIAAADLSGHPARLVLLQIGADDIDFGACLEYQLARTLGFTSGLGTACVQGNAVTPSVATQLTAVRTTLAHAIEAIAPHAGTVAVLDYYQPIPTPAEVADDTAFHSLGTNLVCTGLKANAAATYAAAQVVSGALNHAIAGAVADARAAHVGNVALVDVSKVGDGHGLCTADPWFYSAEPVPDSTLVTDVGRIAAARVCTSTSVLRNDAPCESLTAGATAAELQLKGYVWRAAHPTAAGQAGIARAVEAQLHLASG